MIQLHNNIRDNYDHLHKLYNVHVGSYLYIYIFYMCMSLL